jgi:hypothetical protein
VFFVLFVFLVIVVSSPRRLVVWREAQSEAPVDKRLSVDQALIPR